jgi:dephospho-CoA kinase
VIMRDIRLLIIGHGRHGKDTVAEYFAEYFGLTFESSSYAAARIFLYKALKEKYGYKDFTECYNDRGNRRTEWYNLICEFNKDNKTRLCEAILEHADCYVGLRDLLEVKECMRKELFDLIIWVDASERLPLEDSSSFNISKDLADIIIENNGTLDMLHDKLSKLGRVVLQKRDKL